MSFDESKTISDKVTNTLNKLLDGYDKRIRPDYGGKPVEVGITSKFILKFLLDIKF